MKLCNKELQNRTEWESKGYHLPAFDRETMIAATKAAPAWLHLGAGNIFLAFPAMLAQDLLEKGRTERGIIAVGGTRHERILQVYRPHDDLAVAVTLHANGEADKTVVGSLAETLCMDMEGGDAARLREIFRSASLQIVSITVTEKGYAHTDADGEVLPAVAADLAAGPSGARSYMGMLAALLYERFSAGKMPVALVSMDNCSHNGDLLRKVISLFAERWERSGLVQTGFSDYVKDPSRVGFPTTMIDKITPRPDHSIAGMLIRDGLEEVGGYGPAMDIFVNAEESQYLVVEEWFPNGRPPLEETPGVFFADKDTVVRAERMKVSTCLNPLHTALAVCGCLLGYTKIADEMSDMDLKELVELIGYWEGLPVVTDPGILDPKEFLRTCIEVRFPNPYNPDAPQRIAMDTSQKMSVRFGVTIRAYAESTEHDINELSGIPFVIAAWLRYLLAVDDQELEFELSSDPLLPYLTKIMAPFHMGERPAAEEALKRLAPVLSNAEIFGIDLVKAGLAEKIIADFLEMLEGPGAVRRLLYETVTGSRDF